MKIMSESVRDVGQINKDNYPLIIKWGLEPNILVDFIAYINAFTIFATAGAFVVFLHCIFIIIQQLQDWSTTHN